MAMCKPDLVAAVLKQLGQPVPDADTLTRAVFAASAQLKRENGLNEADCLLLGPVNSKWYADGVRAQAKVDDKYGKRGSIQV